MQSNPYQKATFTKQPSVGGNQPSNYVSQPTTNHTNSNTLGNKTGLGQYNNSYFHQASYQPPTNSGTNGQVRPGSSGYMGPYGKVPSNGSGALIKKK